MLRRLDRDRPVHHFNGHRMLGLLFGKGRHVIGKRRGLRRQAHRMIVQHLVGEDRRGLRAQQCRDRFRQRGLVLRGQRGRIGHARKVQRFLECFNKQGVSSSAWEPQIILGPGWESH